MLREELELEDRDMSKLLSLSGIFRLSGFRCKDLDVKIENTFGGSRIGSEEKHTQHGLGVKIAAETSQKPKKNRVSN